MMEDSSSNVSTLSGHPIYIAGKDLKQGLTYEKMSLRDKVITEVSCYSYVRATPTQAQNKDLVDNYFAIVSSSAFVFVLNKASLSDPLCLNQLGTALSYNIPIIAVRDQDFELPKPLPTRYYQTEIVDKTALVSNDKKPYPNIDTLPALGTLAAALAKLYSSSIVHNLQSSDDFTEQLVRSLAGQCRPSKVLKGFQSSASDASSSSDESNIDKTVHDKNYIVAPTAATSPHRERMTNKERFLFHKDNSSHINDAKQLSKDKAAHLKKRPKPRAAVKTKSASNVRTSCSPVVSNGQALSFNISVIPPSPAPQSPLSFRKVNYSRPFKIVRGLNIGTAKLSLTYGAEVPSQGKGRGRWKSGGKARQMDKELPNTVVNIIKPDTKEGEIDELRERSNTTNTCAVDTKGETKPEKTTDVKKKRSPRHSLRRYSSLPVIPTQYLVTSNQSKQPPVVYHYPPGATTPMRLSISSPQYSGTEEDEFESIHISRTCTPVVDIETDAGYVTPTSPTQD